MLHMPISTFDLISNPPYLIVAVFGLLIGSFISMLSYRLPREMSLFGRSICDTCKRTIGIAENVPVLYYLLSGGRCRGCKGKISPRYPLIEVFTAFCFVTTTYIVRSHGIIPPIFQSLEEFSLVAILFVLTMLITSFVVDLEEQILPDQITVILSLFLLFVTILSPSPLFFTSLFSGFLAFSFFLFIYLVTKGRGMGFGDVKLVFVLGALLSLKASLVWLNIAFVAGALVGLILVVLGKAKLSRAIPFGPFLITGAFVSLFFSEAIFSWYISLFSR